MDLVIFIKKKYIRIDINYYTHEYFNQRDEIQKKLLHYFFMMVQKMNSKSNRINFIKINLNNF